MHPLPLKGVRHILTFKPQWLLRELPNLTLEIMRSTHTICLFILYESQKNSEYFTLQQLLDWLL